MRQQRFAVIVLLAMVIAAATALSVLAAVEGVDSITVTSSERRTPSVGINITAQAGNITRISISAVRQTGAWQGFAGNITGSIVLDDASGDRFYQWSLTSISGEIYASRNSSIDFNNVFPHNNCTIDETLTGSAFADRVNRTYFRNTNTVNFSVGTIAINSSTACAALPFINSTSQSATAFENLSRQFENVILTAESANTTNQSDQQQGNQSIYTGILENSVAGFDVAPYHFQLLVPVDRTTRFNTYFFYAELN